MKRQLGAAILAALAAVCMARAQNEAAQTAESFPIKIRITKNRWATVMNTSLIAMVSPVELEYQKVTFKDKKVRVVSEMTLDKGGGKVSTYRLPMEPVEIQAEKGLVYGTFAVPSGSLEGVGEMALFLEDMKKKQVSNRVILPVAAGAAAEKELEAKHGPSKIEEKK